MALFVYICPLIFLASLRYVTAEAVLKCWRCSTDVSNGEFCNDPFHSDSITDQQRYWSFVNCTYSVGVKSVNARPVCKKIVQEVYGKRVISRSCFYENIDITTDKCDYDTTAPYIKTIFCQTCSSDGCNGVSQLIPATLILLVSCAISILLFKITLNIL